MALLSVVTLAAPAGALVSTGAIRSHGAARASGTHFSSLGQSSSYIVTGSSHQCLHM